MPEHARGLGDCREVPRPAIVRREWRRDDRGSTANIKTATTPTTPNTAPNIADRTGTQLFHARVRWPSAHRSLRRVSEPARDVTSTRLVVAPSARCGRYGPGASSGAQQATRSAGSRRLPRPSRAEDRSVDADARVGFGSSRDANRKHRGGQRPRPLRRVSLHPERPERRTGHRPRPVGFDSSRVRSASLGRPRSTRSRGSTRCRL